MAAAKWSCFFLAATLPDELVLRLQAEQIKTVFLEQLADGPVTTGSEQDALDTANLAKQLGAAWVVADGYKFAAAFQTKICEAGLRCAIVTDFDFCPEWTCDLVLNQNPHAMQESYASLTPTCQRLLGTKFALLRQEFLEDKTQRESRQPQDTKRLLMTFGGSDPPNATGHLLKLLEACDHPPLEIRLLMGVANPHQTAVALAAGNSRHRIEFLIDVRDMPQQYRWADGIISASGSTCWEWLYFGLDAAILVIAENQIPIYHELTFQGTALGLGTIETLRQETTQAQGKLTQLLHAMKPGEAQATRYRQIVDGYGAHRVAAALDSGIWLRQATEQDQEMYFQWANDPIVRNNSLCTDKIKWQQHCQWFEKQLAAEDVQLLVAMRNETSVGQIRFQKNSEQAWNVGFSIASAARGTGAGKELLRLGSAWMEYRGLLPLVATVKEDNQNSARCFRRLGWKEIPSDQPDQLQFCKEELVSP